MYPSLALSIIDFVVQIHHEVSSSHHDFVSTSLCSFPVVSTSLCSFPVPHPVCFNIYYQLYVISYNGVCRVFPIFPNQAFWLPRSVSPDFLVENNENVSKPVGLR